MPKSFTDDLPRFLAASGLSRLEESLVRSPFLAAFGGELSTRCEFSVEPGAPVLGLMAWGKGAAFEEKLDAYVAENLEERALLERVRRYFPGVGALVKCDLGGRRPGNISIYWQYPLPLKVLPRLFRALGLPTGAGSLALQAGALLGERRFFTALDLEAGAPPALGVIFTKPAPLPPGALDGIFDLVPAIEVRSLGEHAALQAEARGLAYLSLAVSEGLPVPTVKIDYENVPLAAAFRVEEALGRRADSLELALREMGIENPQYYGLRHYPGRPPRGKLYFIRPYMTAMEDLASAFRETRWS